MPIATALTIADARSQVTSAYERVTGLQASAADLVTRSALDALALRLTDAPAAAQRLSVPQAEDLIAETYGRARGTADGVSQILTGSVGALAAPAEPDDSYRLLAVRSVLELAGQSAAFAAWANADLATGVASAVAATRGASDPALAAMTAHWTSAGSLAFFRQQAAQLAPVPGLDADDMALAFAVGMLADVAVRDMSGALGRDVAAALVLRAEGAAVPASIAGLGGTSSYRVDVASAGPTSQIVTVTRDGELAAATLSFDFAGTALAGSDYTVSGLAGDSLRLAAGQSTATFRIDLVGDGVVEPTEEIIVTLASASDGVGVRSTVMVVIEDDDTAYALAVDRAATQEADQDEIVFTVTRTGQLVADDLRIGFMTGSGMAVAGQDFTLGSDLVSFAAGETSKTFAVRVLSDGVFEGTETLSAFIASSNAGGTLPAAPTATTISDDAATTYTIANAPGAPEAIAEDGADTLRFEVSRTGALDAATVTYTLSGTAVAGADYAAPTGTLTFAAGQTTATIALDPIADGIIETNEIVTVTLADLGPNPNASVAPGGGSATGTIVNDDEAVYSIAVSPAEITEGDTVPLTSPLVDPSTGQWGLMSAPTGGAKADKGGLLLKGGALPATASAAPGSDTAFTFTVGRTNTSEAATVTIELSGLATLPGRAGADYTLDGIVLDAAGRGTVTFLAGQATVSFTATPVDDAVLEPTETLTATIAAVPRGASIESTMGSATARILDDDTTYGIADAAPVEEDGAANLVYTVTRTGVLDAETVTYALSGTADGADYADLGSGTVTFAAGAATAQIVIDPTADATVEPDETVVVTLTGTSGNGTLDASRSTAQGIIQNDDTTGPIAVYSIAASPSTLLEDAGLLAGGGGGGGGGVTVVDPTEFEFTVTRTLAFGAATVEIDFSADSATADDYTVFTLDALGNEVPFGPTDRLAFADGQSEAIFYVRPVDDDTIEPDETLTATIGTILGPPAIASSTQGSAQVTIENDDAQLYSLVRLGPESATENGGTLTFEVSRNFSGTAGEVTIEPFYSGGVSPEDVTVSGISPGNRVVFAAGETTRTITYTGILDALDEGDETLEVLLSSVTVGPGAVDFSGAYIASGTLTDEAVYQAGFVGGQSTTVEGSVASDNPFLSYEITRTDTSGPATIEVRFGSATPDANAVSAIDIQGSPTGPDYVQTAAGPGFFIGTVTFAAGQATSAITVEFEPDTVLEGDEVLPLAITNTNGTGLVLGGPAVGTVIDDDGAPAYSITSFTTGGADVFTETEGQALFRVTRDDASVAESVRIDMGGDATRGVDYTLSSEIGADGTVFFAAGQSTVDFLATGIFDEGYEGEETIVATIAAVPAGSTGTGSTTSRILYDERPAYSVRFEPSNAIDDAAFAGPRQMEVVITRELGTTDGAVELELSGTADASDYTVRGGRDFSTPARIDFAAGQTEVRVTLDVTLDALAEGPETVVATLSNQNDPYTIDVDRATAVIRDDDTVPTYTIAAGSSRVIESDYVFTYTLVRSETVGDAIVTLDLSGGTATYGVDYDDFGSGDGSNVRVTFFDGDATATLEYYLNDDLELEGRESVEAVITGVTGGGTFSSTPEVVFIEDDETDPLYRIELENGASTTSFIQTGEGDAPLGDVFTYRVTREGVASSLGTATVAIALDANSTATQGEDFVFIDAGGNTITNPTVTFAGADTTATGRIRLIGDTVPEANETIRLGLGDPSDGGAVDASFAPQIVIQNDDFRTFFQVSGSVEGGAPGTDTILEGGTPDRFEVTVTRSGVLDDTDVEMRIFGSAIRDGAFADYAFVDPDGVIQPGVASNTRSIDFAPGEDTATFFVRVLDDTRNESATESIFLQFDARDAIGAQVQPSDPFNLTFFITDDE